MGEFGAILLWSTTIACVRRLSEDVGPVTAATAVHGIAGALALLALLGQPDRRRQIRKLPDRYLFGCGGLVAGYTLLLYLAIGQAANRQEVLAVGLLNYLWPTLALVFSLVLLGERATWVLIPGTLLAMVGVFLVLMHGATVSSASWFQNVGSHPTVYLLAAGAAVCWALYSNLARKWAGGQTTGAMSVFLPVIAGLLFLLSCTLDEPHHWSRRAVAELLFQGITTYASYALWDNAMRRGRVVTVAAASYLTPLLSTIISCLYLAIFPGANLWFGCGLLILGSGLSYYSVNQASRSTKLAIRYKNCDGG
ncbi:MAG: aromatic amino acid DMT transporter YddG [Verrucomicrobiota bacterium]